MERLTDYQVPIFGNKKIYPCFSKDIIPQHNCSIFFCDKAKECEFTNIKNRMCPYLRIIDKLAAYEDTGLTTACAQELSQAEKDGRLVILPPNDPLTLEELREMGGEPVWVYNTYNGWCTCRVIDEMDANSIFFTDGMARYLKMYGNGWTAYRRKPEDKNNEPDSSC